jgi:prevent-host-death family protein
MISGVSIVKVVNIGELKKKTNDLLREVMRGNTLIITYRGKPAASIVPFTENSLEDFMITNSPSIRKKITKAEEDLRARRVVSFQEYLLGLKK